MSAVVGKSSQSGEQLLYTSTGVSPLRVLTIVSLAFAMGSTVLAGLLMDSSARIGNAITWFERSVWAGGLLTVFCGFFLAVWSYERRIASSITLARDGRSLRVSTATLFGMRERDVLLDDLITSNYHDGDTKGEESISPPWLYVKVRNAQSFVVPLGGGIPNHDKLMQVLSVQPH